MTTVEFSEKLDMARMKVNLNDYTEEELEVIKSIGRIVRNLELLNDLLSN